MGINYSGLGKAKASNRFSKLDQTGDYLLKIKAIKEAESFEGGGMSFVIEQEVVESTNPKIKPGEDRSCTINRLDSKKPFERESAMSNLKLFLAAALAGFLGEYVDPNQEELDGDELGWEKAVKTALDQDGLMFVGTLVRAKVNRIDTKTTKDMKKAGTFSEAQIDEKRFPLTVFRPADESLIPGGASAA